jgi:3-deoxy-manno-octulosonate cytidylyltransferase (CMP-KDO synthetase)
MKFTQLNPTNLELAEKLEQMRLLQNGYKIHCIPTDLDLFGVDTAEDYQRVCNYFKKIENS